MSVDDVLVVTVRKSFWASEEAERFPHRVYARVFFGHSTNLLNSAFVFLRGLLAIRRRKPRIVLLGSVERTVPWFIRARRLGLLGDAQLVVTNQLHLSDEQLRFVDRNVVYSQAWIDAQRPAVRERAVFVPLPADGDFGAALTTTGGHVFTGGGTGRDFGSVIAAVQGLDVAVELVTFSQETLGWDGDLPPNVHVHWLMPLRRFLALAGSAKAVVVALRDSHSDFGQTTVVQALSLGVPVVATRSPGIVDYVTDGQEGLLVEAGDVDGYRAAILRLTGDEEFRRACAEHACRRATGLTYAAFARRLEAILVGLSVRGGAEGGGW
jgi:glycosyltransferase involved in cell wall biosynthesis